MLMPATAVRAGMSNDERLAFRLMLPRLELLVLARSGNERRGMEVPVILSAPPISVNAGTLVTVKVDPDMATSPETDANRGKVADEYSALPEM